MNDRLLEAARQAIRSAQQILIVSHERPDGDAVGSLLGLGLALQAAGKNVQMVLNDGVPEDMRHLPGSQQIKSRRAGQVDLSIVVDCSDQNRVGGALDGLPIPDINIDHHITNANFARLNLVEPKAASTAEMLTEMLPQLGFPLPPPAAAALLTGILTDTIGFRTNNVRPKTLRLAATLMEIGADLPALYKPVLLQRTLLAARYWGRGLCSLEYSGRLLWATLTLQDRQAAGYLGNDDADLINLLSAINDMDIVIVFIEQDPDRVKISWRAQPGFDVSQIAARYGGGGHQAASGAMAWGSLNEVKTKILDATRALLGAA
jgi:phosphoesterase RecJ-like protein